MATQRSTHKPLLTRHQSLRLRKLLLQLPNLHQVGGLNVLLAGLPVGLAKSLPVGQPPNHFVVMLVDLVTSDAWAELPDGSRPVLIVIENAMAMLDGSRLHQEFGRLLDEVLSQSGANERGVFSSPSEGNFWAATCLLPLAPASNGHEEPHGPEHEYRDLVTTALAGVNSSTFIAPKFREPLTPVGDMADIRVLSGPKRLCDLRALLASRRRLLILGPPGAGKTSVLKYLAYAYAQESSDRVIPIMISLRAWMPGAAGAEPPSVVQLARRFLQTPLGIKGISSVHLASELENYLRGDARQRLLFLFDDLNRVGGHASGRPAALAAIRQFAKEHSGVWMVLASRQDDYKYDLEQLCGDLTFHVVLLTDWDCDQIARYVDAWDLPREYARDPRFLTLATTPAHLLQLARLLKSGGAAKPRSLGDVPTLRALRRAYIDWLAEGRSDDGALRRQLKNALLRLAGGLAAGERRGRYVSLAEARQYLQPGDAEISAVDPLAAWAGAGVLDHVEDPQLGEVAGFQEQLLEDYCLDLARRSTEQLPGDAVDEARAMEEKGWLESDGRRLTCP